MLISLETLLVGAIFLLLGAAVAFLLLRRQGGHDDGLAQMVAELTGRLSQISEDSQKSTAALTRALEDRLDKVTERMGKSLEETATNTAKSLGELQTRLKVIDEAQKNLVTLSNDIVGLQHILDNKQARGAFGEVQLSDLVSSILPPSAYSFQTTLTNGKRADCLIILPNPPGPIVVDAKFPLESYHALAAAQSEADKTVARRAFSADILKHVADISARYIIPGETAESALMFLPSEAVYAELHAKFPEVVEKSYRSRVWIVSPTTLMATLNTVRAVLKDVKMREQAGLIQKEVGALLADVVRLDKRVDSLGKHFHMAERDIRDIQTSTGKITRRTERISEVRIEDGEGDEGLTLTPPDVAAD